MGQDFLPDRTADGDLLFTFSSNILDFRRFKIWLAARRLFSILSLARPLRHPKSSFRSLLKQLFCRETRVRGQFMANPGPVMFAGVLA